MTIGNCAGCEEEWSYACDLATNCGATLVQQEITHIGERKHFLIMMVSEKDGHIMVS